MLLRLVGLLEVLSGVLQVTAKVFTGLHDLSSGRTPLLVELVVTLAADALPVAFKLAHVALDLRLDLIADLIIKLEEDGTELTHQVSVYMNCRHCL